MENEELKTINESVYGLMCKLAVGEKLVVPLCTWKAVRSFAHGLKKRVDRYFTVNRIHSGKTKLDFLLIIRTQ